MSRELARTEDGRPTRLSAKNVATSGIPTCRESAHRTATALSQWEESPAAKARSRLIRDVNQSAAQRANSQNRDGLQGCSLSSRRCPTWSEGGGDHSIEVPGQKGVQTRSPYPEVKPGKQRTNHGSFRASIIDQRKTIDAQLFGEAIESVLDSQQHCQMQKASCNVVQTQSADELGPHLCEFSLFRRFILCVWRSEGI